MTKTNFYNSLASSYDGMINFEEALKRRKETLSSLIQNSFRTAADIGCGSGIDAISLSQLGLKVAAFDPSEEMLNKARKNAINHSTENIQFCLSGASNIDSVYYNQFNFITCLGNTLSNIPDKEIHESVNNFYKLLRPGGKVVLQIVNYKKLITEDKRILSITKNEEYTFVRFYDYMDNKIIFNILKFENKNTNNYELISTEVFSYSSEYLLSLFNKAGFSNIKVQGDLKGSSFDKKLSKDLIIIAEK